MKHFWEKWEFGLWLSDHEVAKASPSARGLFFEALNVMMKSSAFSLSGTIPELAKQLRFSEAECAAACADLARTNPEKIVTCNGVVTLMSRHMERKHKDRVSNRKRQVRRRSNASVTVLSQRVAAKCTPPLSDSNSDSNSIPKGESEGEPEQAFDGSKDAAKSKRKAFSPPTVDECKGYAVTLGLPDAEGEKFWCHYESNGWKVGKNPMKSWRAAMSGTWKHNFLERGTYGGTQHGRPSGSGNAKATGATFEQSAKLNDFDEFTKRQQEKRRGELGLQDVLRPEAGGNAGDGATVGERSESPPL
jgi:hypothetical protein